MDLAFFGHHKCASTSTEALCFDLCNRIGYHPVYKKTAFISDLSPYLKNGNKNFIISINSKYEGIDPKHDFRGIHLIRDPRDICISGYFSHLHSHKLEGFDRLVNHRNKLKEVDFNEGLILEFDFNDFWLEHLENWNYDDNRILEIKMESLISSPRETWLKIFEWLKVLNKEKGKLNLNIEKVFEKMNHYMRHLGIRNAFLKNGLSEESLVTLSDKYSFNTLSNGREAGDEDIKSHYRKGKSGDWKNYFTEEHIVCFKEKYGKLLMKLGYEENLDW